jgi:hypothetical protein
VCQLLSRNYALGGGRWKLATYPGLSHTGLLLRGAEGLDSSRLSRGGVGPRLNFVVASFLRRHGALEVRLLQCVLTRVLPHCALFNDAEHCSRPLRAFASFLSPGRWMDNLCLTPSSALPVCWCSFVAPPQDCLAVLTARWGDPSFVASAAWDLQVHTSMLLATCLELCEPADAAAAIGGGGRDGDEDDDDDYHLGRRPVAPSAVLLQILDGIPHYLQSAAPRVRVSLERSAGGEAGRVESQRVAPDQGVSAPVCCCGG